MVKISGFFNANMGAIDEYIFGPQTTDISEGRLPDGGLDWIFFEYPTPGISNEYSDIITYDESLALILYPNPATGGIVYLNSPLNFKVYNIYGQIVADVINDDQIDISEYPNGIYIVVSDKGIKQKLIVN